MAAWINKPKKKKRNYTHCENRKIRQSFYNTSEWHTLRGQYISEHPLCEKCLKEGKTVPVAHIHHKVSFMKGLNDVDRWRLFLDVSNLQALCVQCHLDEHKAKKYGDL